MSPAPNRDPIYGGIEAGGTKFVGLVGSGPSSILAQTRIEVTGPDETIAAARDFFATAETGGRPILAIGIGSFGPVELRANHPKFGWITNTPKPGWRDTNLVGAIRSAFDVPVGFDTDVNAAALAEGRWGAARGLDSYIYLTLGTGIGGGAVVDGRLVRGLGHPEMGHIAVPRREGDQFDGICPFHGDCLEGMASGPALAARFGQRAETLSGADAAMATEIVAHYLAAGARTLIYTLAPERIVVGGGLGSMRGLMDAARSRLARELAGYPGLEEHDAADMLMPAGLGGMAGPLGTLILAEQAFSRSRESSRRRGPGARG